MGFFKSNFFNKPVAKKEALSKKAEYSIVSLNDLKVELSRPLAKTEWVSKTEPKKDEVLRRVGADGIILNYTNASDIQHKYGMAYDFYNINDFTLEMKYFELGLSCFFHISDPDKKIFSIRITEPFRAFKKLSKAISSGMMEYPTMHDVFNHEQEEVQLDKSYDETYVLNYGFYRYHFLPEGEPVKELSRVESITLVADGI